jgi:hypothetical protein
MEKIRKTLATSFFVFVTCSLTYGQLNFAKGSQFNPRISYGMLKDSRDGIMYKTIEIGAQTWMAENLRYKVPNDSFAFDQDESIAERF